MLQRKKITSPPNGWLNIQLLASAPLNSSRLGNTKLASYSYFVSELFSLELEEVIRNRIWKTDSNEYRTSPIFRSNLYQTLANTLIWYCYSFNIRRLVVLCLLMSA